MALKPFGEYHWWQFRAPRDLKHFVKTYQTYHRYGVVEEVYHGRSIPNDTVYVEIDSDGEIFTIQLEAPDIYRKYFAPIYLKDLYE